MKKFYFIFFLVFISVIFAGIIFGGFLFFSSDNKEKEVINPMIIGYNYWPGVLPVLVADKNGFFKEEGLEATLNYQESYYDLLEGVSSGSIDLANDIVLVDAINNFYSNKSIKVIGVSDYSFGADGFVVDESIKLANDLIGKKIAVEKGTVGEYLLYAILQRFGLSFNDIIIADLSANSGVDAFLEQKVDGVVSYEPDLSRAKRRRASRLMASSADFPGLVTDVITVNSKYLRENPESIKAFLKAYFRAVDYIKENPETSMKIGAEYFSTLPEEFIEGYNLIKLLDFNDNRIALSYVGGYKSIFGSGKYLFDLLVYQNKFADNFNWEDMIDISYYNNIYNK